MINGILGTVKDVIELPTFSIDYNDLKWCLVLFCIQRSQYAAQELFFEFRSKESKFFYINGTVYITIFNNAGAKITVKKDFSLTHEENSASSGQLHQYMIWLDTYRMMK